MTAKTIFMRANAHMFVIEAYSSVCVHECVCMWVCVGVCVCMCMWVYVHVWVCVHEYAYV